MTTVDSIQHTGGVRQLHHEFWRQRLALVEEPLRLAGPAPGAGAPPGGPEARLASELPLDGEAWNVVRQISKGAPLGALVVVAAALARVCATYARRRSVVLETPPLQGGAAPDPRMERVPLVLEVEPGWTVRDLLRSCQQTVSQSYSLQDYPVHRLREEAVEPLTDLFLSVPEIHLQTASPPSGCPLELTLDPGRGSLRIRHDPSRFSAARVRDLARHLEAVLHRFSRLEERIEDVALLTPEEREELLRSGRGPAVALPRNPTIPDLLAGCVAAGGDRVAVESAAGTLSYRQLGRRVAALGAHLAGRLAIRRGDVVAVVGDRSSEWVVGMLAAWQIGAVYLPLDPEQPAARHAAILEEARPRALLGRTGSLDAVAFPGPKLAVDAFHEEGAPPPVQAPAPGDLAYLIFTSGSQGRPKGVMVEHLGFVNMILDQARTFGVQPHDRVLLFASASFDASLAESLIALLTGAALVLVDAETMQHADRFAACLDERGITVLSTTPLYLSALEGRPLPTVRILITAGEPAHRESARRYSRALRMFNAYGPTETSVCATIHPVDPEDPYAAGIPIGRPVANSAVYVLDPELRPVPAGVPGEICVAGVGVARGYLHGEGAEPRFLEDPQAPGRRLYRTGDLGTWSPAGDLHFLGRLDDQVKIRGYRIEPAEIEAALQAHPDIRETHVAPLPGPEGSPRDLAAYFTRRGRIEIWPSIAEFHVYDDVVYRSMARDERRNSAYRAALLRHAAGRTVLEIGPGPELVLSRLCLEAGARQVYAVELSGETAAKARDKVRALGLEDRIQVIHGDIRDVELPGQADLCVSEIVGSIGGAEGAAVLIEHARRFLRDPAAQIPARSSTQIAALELPEGAWDPLFPETAAHYVEKIFAQAGRPFDLRICLKGLSPDRLLSTRDVFEDLDFRRALEPEHAHEIRLRMLREGSLDGFLVWLCLQVDPDLAAPEVDILESTESWLPVYLPLEPPGLRVQEGDEIRATVERRLGADRLGPDFTLTGHLVRAGRSLAPIACVSPHAAPGFRGSPFYRQIFRDGRIPTKPELSAAGLRRFLGERLPSYLIPAFFQELERLPRTPSGKVDRRALPSPGGPEAGRVPVPPRTPEEAALLAVWEEVLGRHPLSIHDNYYSLGGDSIRALQIVARLGARQWEIQARDLFDRPTVAELAPRLRRKQRSPAQAPVEGRVPLTPVQAWFFAEHRGDPRHFNQALLLRSRRPLKPELLRDVLAALAGHHDALRARFRRDAGEWVQEIAAPGDAPPGCEVIDLRRSAEPVRELELHADRLHAGFDLERGPLLQAACFRLPDGDRLLLVVHHLVVDWVSWRFLIEDLRRGYAQRLAGQPVALPPKTDSFQHWAERLQALAGDPALARQRPWWEALARTPEAPLPRDGEHPDNRVAEAARVSVELPEEATGSLLTETRRAYNAGVDDLLLTALARALETWRGRGGTLVLVERHGRDAALEGVDVSRTVGWFTSFFPVLLDLGGETEPGRQIKRIKETLRSVPGGGLGYGVLAYLAGESSLLVRPAVSFNYLGVLDGGGELEDLGMAGEPHGRAIGAEAERTCEIDLLASVVDGRLQLGLEYNARRLRESTARDLAQDLLREVARLADYCRGRETSEATLSDMTFTGISQAEFDQLFDD